MMEEVSDDTNGESTFEFVGGKSDENILKEAATSSEEVKLIESSSVQQSTPVSVPPESTIEQTNLPLYNPAPSYFTPLPSTLPPPPAPGPFAETQVWNQYTPSATPVSQAPVSILDPGTSHYSVSMPYVEAQPNPALPLGNEGGGGVWGWIKGNQLLNKVAERAKSSVDSVITTLDPGMKEIINTGGDINVIVASGNEAKVSAVREAFQLVFGKAIVQGVAVQSSSIAPQPVGFSAGLKVAEERISNLRQQGYSDSSYILLAIENFIAELTPDNWFDMGCLLLQDQNSGVSLQVYTEAIPISSLHVAQAKEQTPPDYPLGWSGHAITVGQIIGSSLGVHHSEWHQAVTGVPRREILLLAAKSIAGLYRSHMRR